jgi:hypothetical protein
MTFEQWWDTVANTPAPDTFKNWEESCRQAWADGANAEREACIEDVRTVGGLFAVECEALINKRSHQP